MIYVSKSQLNQVEYLLEQSIKGNHILFDSDTVRRIFLGEWNHGKKSSSGKQVQEEGAKVEGHIEKLIGQPTLAEKRAYLETLDPTTFELVVRTYFNIVENNIVESRGVTH